MNNVEKVRLLNVYFDNCSEQYLLENLKEGMLSTPNVDHVVKMQSDKEFFDIVRGAEYVVCDSKILFLLSKIIGRPFRQVIPGSEFFPHFYMYHRDDESCKIFLMGAMEGVALRAMDNINKKVGRKIVIGAYSPSLGFENSQEENEKIIKIINDSGANVVLVGVGCPKQEKWINTYKNNMPNVKIWLALGATIDFEAGNKKRAPKFFRYTATEWLYRSFQEPSRIGKRVIKDLPFLWLLLKDALGSYKNPFEG